MPTLEERLDALEFRIRGLEIGQENLDIRAEIDQVLSDLEPISELEFEDNLLLPASVRKKMFMDTLPEWQNNRIYTVSTVVKHNGRAWIALPDVAIGIPPDDVYDVGTNTGGWIPVGDE